MLPSPFLTSASLLSGRGKENGFRSKLFTCLRCPRAYHANCLPPGAKFHEYLCLCPEHAHMGLPPLPGDEETYNNDVSDRVRPPSSCKPNEPLIEYPAEDNNQRSHSPPLSLLSTSTGRRLDVAGAQVAGPSPWAPFAVHRRGPLPPQAAVLQRGLLQATALHPHPVRPPTHTVLPPLLCRPLTLLPPFPMPPPPPLCSGLRYICKVLPAEPGSECQCEGPCGPTCLNRILHIEYVPYHSHPRVPRSVKKEPFPAF